MINNAKKCAEGKDGFQERFVSKISEDIEKSKEPISPEEIQ
jgi:hypothetical protein